jgi:hypothetical protein
MKDIRLFYPIETKYVINIKKVQIDFFDIVDTSVT